MKHLLEHWGLELGDGDFITLQTGVWHARTSEGSFILKRRGTRSSVWAEYDLINWLRRYNQPISPLLYTKKEAPWAEEDGSIYVLYRYLPGIPGNELEQIDLKLVLESGASLACLHRDLATYPAAGEFLNFDVFHEVASFAWPAVRGYLGPKFGSRLADLEEGISHNLVNPYEALPRQLIHRDFHLGNLIFQDQRVVGILDFDRVRLGIRVYDLCYLATSILSDMFSDYEKRENWFDIVQALLAGYGTVQPLTRTEEKLFLYIIYLIQFMFIAYQLDMGNTKLADLNAAMLFWINDQHDLLEPLISKAVAGK